MFSADYNTSVFFIRIAIAFLYLYAGYMNCRNKESIQWTIDNIKILFKNTPFQDIPILAKYAAYSGIFIMFIGGMSILLGIGARLGSLLLILFTIGGTIIHYRQRNEARDMALKNTTNAELSSLAWSAFSAHFANILKNLSLILILCFICFYGVGEYKLIRFFLNY